MEEYQAAKGSKRKVESLVWIEEVESMSRGKRLKKVHLASQNRSKRIWWVAWECR